MRSESRAGASPGWRLTGSPDERALYAPIGDVALAVDALGVDPEHHVYAMAGPLCGFRRMDSRVQPQRDGRVAQVVRPGSERRGDLLGVKA